MAYSESVEEQSHFGPETHRRLEVVPVGLTSEDKANHTLLITDHGISDGTYLLMGLCSGGD